ncbi:MAG: hypothetical protein K2Y22_08210 [Candidatus Obscuribacterales bacterium]|nr:hypothetical protein [Candidatus Obscuribacterales bacterium]
MPCFDRQTTKLTNLESTSTDNVRQGQFGNASSYKDQVSALRKDDQLKESTYSFMLAQAADDVCYPTDADHAFDKFRICIETSTLRKALKSKDADEIKDACDEINSNEDAWDVHSRLTSDEQLKVELLYLTDKSGKPVERLIPKKQKKAH